MKRIFILLAFICGVTIPSLAQQSGYGGDGKASSSASVSSFIRLYETAPGAATTALAGAGAGSVDNGAHLVKVTCYTPGGETTGGTVSNSTTVADKTTNGKIALTGIPTCSNFATGRKVYMTAAGGSSYFLLSNGTIANNTATTLTANDADATLTASTALPTSNTALDTRLTIGQTNSSLGGVFSVGDSSLTTAQFNVTPYATTTMGLLVKLLASHTGDALVVQKSDATTYFRVKGAGAVQINQGKTLEIYSGNFATLLTYYDGSAGWRMGNAQYLSWSNAAAADGTNDVALYRHGLNALEVNTATAGTTADLIARNLALGHGTIATAIGAAPTHGQNLTILTGEESLTIAAAATTDTAMTIPANAVVLSVSVRVTTVIPTAATFTVIGTSSSTVFNTAAVNVAANTVDTGTKNCPYYNATAQTIRITPNLTPADNTGRVRVTVVYYVVTPPTS